MSADYDLKPAQHCHHCGRRVRGTIHTRTSYRVDYYHLHTGEVEPVTIVQHTGEVPLIAYRLLRAYEIVTCVDCYHQPSVRQERDALFRPELARRESAESSGGGSSAS